MRWLSVLLAIPKKHTVFRFEIPQPTFKGGTEASTEEPKHEGTLQPRNLDFELHGSQFEHRPADRATKKMKQRNMTDL